MKVIRKVLILSFNYDWAGELKTELEKVAKLDTMVASTRTIATKLLSENEFDLILIEETYKIKNMDYLLRVLSTLKSKPKYVFLAFNDFDLYKTVMIPSELNELSFKAISMPLPKEIISQILIMCLFPYGLKEDASFDREFIEVLIRSCKKVLTSFNVEGLKPGRPMTLQKIDQEDLNISIRGKIILKNTFFNGSVFISFPEETFLKFSNKVLAADSKEIDSSNRDFASEFTNMVYGQSKKEFEQHGVNLDMAIPIIDESKTITPGKKPVFVIPFESSVGKFFIKVAPDVY